MFSLPSVAINPPLENKQINNNNEKHRERERDIHPVHARARWKGLQILSLLGGKHIYQGMNYLSFVFERVCAFLFVCVCVCWQKHVCLDFLFGLSEAPLRNKDHLRHGAASVSDPWSS